MSCRSITELARAERQDIAIREVVRTCGLRLGIHPYDRSVAMQCALNAWRAGASPADAVARGTRYLRLLHGDRDGAA